jgi:hypothetical protein
MLLEDAPLPAEYGVPKTAPRRETSIWGVGFSGELSERAGPDPFTPVTRLGGNATLTPPKPKNAVWQDWFPENFQVAYEAARRGRKGQNS